MQDTCFMNSVTHFVSLLKEKIRILLLFLMPYLWKISKMDDFSNSFFFQTLSQVNKSVCKKMIALFKGYPISSGINIHVI